VSIGAYAVNDLPDSRDHCVRTIKLNEVARIIQDSMRAVR